MDTPAPRNLRLRFEKTGDIRFISHLDLSRALHRAFFRAKIPLKYSEGFSPHPKFSLVMPLSVGTESLTELADFSLAEGCALSPDEIQKRLADQLPAGLTVRAVEEMTEKPPAPAFASYRVFLPKTPPDAIPAIEAALGTPLLVEKKNKKGKPVEKDVSPGIREIHVRPREGGVELSCLLSASAADYLGPDLLIRALVSHVPALDPAGKETLREAIFTAELQKI